MFTFNFWFISSIKLIAVFVMAVALVYLTKLIDLWLENRKKRTFYYQAN